MNDNSVFDVFDNPWLCQDWFLQDDVPPSSHDPGSNLGDYGSSTRPADPHTNGPPQSRHSEVHMSNWEEPQKVSSMPMSMPVGAFPWRASNNFVASSMQNSEIHPKPSPPTLDPVPRKRRRSANSSISNSVASSTSGDNRPKGATATRRESRQHGKARKAKSSGCRVSIPNTGSAMTSAYSSCLPHHGHGSSGGSSSSNSALGVQPSGSILQRSRRHHLNNAPSSNTTELTVIESSKRMPHAQVEKKYRESMKAMFRRLRAVLPSSGGSTTGTSPNEPAVHILPLESSPSVVNFRQEHQRKNSEPPSPPPPSQLTKAGVIARAIEYIQQMERDKAYMQDCYERIV
ncbi:hypothetical protein MPH_14080, partial [Macrophomina phaseolina MS6]